MSANAKVANALFGSTFSTSSTSFTDLLNGSGGSPISVTITKSAGTSLLVQADCSSTQNAANDTPVLGVNDGTTDHYVAENRAFTSSHVVMSGSAVISGLSAGTFTIKLRVRVPGGNQINFTTSNSASLMVMEIAP